LSEHVLLSLEVNLMLAEDLKDTYYYGVVFLLGAKMSMSSM